ncbi:MAG: hypothetical protein IPL21_19565 [Saprospirales bacterium]|nr:hypothetical protein [Saprospirales bacterium]
MGKLYINSADLKINTQSNNLVCSGFCNDQDNEVLKGFAFILKLMEAETPSKK